MSVSEDTIVTERRTVYHFEREGSNWKLLLGLVVLLLYGILIGLMIGKAVWNQ